MNLLSKNLLTKSMIPFILSSQVSFAETPVRPEAKHDTPYLESVRGVSAVLSNNFLTLLDKKHPKYSLTESIFLRPRIIKVAKLFADSIYRYELELKPDVYGPLYTPTMDQLRARAKLLSTKFNVVKTKNLKQIEEFTQKAIKNSDAMYYKISGLRTDPQGVEDPDFTLDVFLTYMKLIDDEDFFSEKGLKHVKTYDTTGAKKEHYFFTWTNVTRDKLAHAIATDLFDLMKQAVKKSKDRKDALKKEEPKEEPKEESKES